VFHGGGGYDFDTVYNMPLWIRKMTFQKMQEFFDQKQKAEQPRKKGEIDMANPNKSKIPNKGTISPPNYVTKKSTKR
jgi:hypothetical protein|tara:strand:- start:1579 stop:1809 length:231 start_codon:yes stop_codon:yes gene_type:complete